MGHHAGAHQPVCWVYFGGALNSGWELEREVWRVARSLSKPGGEHQETVNPEGDLTD